MSEFCYLMRKEGTNIFKIGKTTRSVMQRKKEHEKEQNCKLQVITTKKVNDCSKYEKMLITVCNHEFDNYAGYEWYECEKAAILKVIEDICSDEIDNYKHILDKKKVVRKIQKNNMSENSFVCKCNKMYETRQGFGKHKKKCKVYILLSDMNKYLNLESDMKKEKEKHTDDMKDEDMKEEKEKHTDDMKEEKEKHADEIKKIKRTHAREIKSKNEMIDLLKGLLERKNEMIDVLKGDFERKNEMIDVLKGVLKRKNESVH